jgi:PAS domain S-box-containing protein
MQTIASQVAGGIRSAQFIEVQRYYQQIVANSPDPIIVSDSKGKVVVFNKACERIWGFSADEVLGRRVSQFYASEEHAREIGRRLHVSPNSTIEDFHARIKSRTGEIIPISLSASLVRNRLGSLMGSIGVFKDLRQALQLQKEQLTAGKLATLGRLGHTVGHDIKHNIATALNYVDVLAYECSDEELSRIYREIQESLSEAVIKLRNMLMVGRPGLPLMRPITIHEVVREAETLIHQMAASRKVACSIKYSDQEQEMEADVEQLKQVLVNLFDNSIDAIEVKRGSGVEAIGRLEMSVEAVGSWLKLIWTDDGCGIPTERFPQLFIPFNSDKPTGNGLGLFIIKTIIENHRGRIRIESQEGVGTKVEIMLPLSPSEGALVES